MRLLENYANGFLLGNTLAYRGSVYNRLREREGKGGAIRGYKGVWGRKREEGEDVKGIKVEKGETGGKARRVRNKDEYLWLKGMASAR